DIYQQGMTLSQIISGNVPYEAPRTALDGVRLRQDLALRAGTQEREVGFLSMEREHIVTRATVMLANMDSSLTTVAGVQVLNCLPNISRDFCLDDENTILGAGDSLLLDGITGARYYDLLPSSLINDSAEGTRTSVDLAHRRHKYDPSSFPSVGAAWTLSWWSKGIYSGKGPSTLIGVFQDGATNLPCWSVGIRQDSLRIWTTVNGEAATAFKFTLPAEVDAQDFLLLGGQNLRHFSVAVNETVRLGHFYMDGNLIGSSAMSASFAGTLDCAIENTSYIAFAHRPPGSQDWKGDMQQLRLYPGHLDSPQINALAFGSTDPNSRRNLRQCKLPHEGEDSNSFLDLSGHNCEWYRRAMEHTPGACASLTVQRNCPMACGNGKPCFDRKLLDAPAIVHRIWERVQWLASPPDSVTDHSACLAQTSSLTEILQRCRARPQYPKYTSALQDAQGAFLNVTDCNTLAASVSQYCEFSVPDNWTSSFGAEVSGKGGTFTTIFWIKAAGAAATASTFAPTLQLFSGLSPAEPFLSLWVTAGAGAHTSAVLHRHKGGQPETIELGGRMKAGEWTQVAVSLGSEDPAGNRQLALVVNTRFTLQLLEKQTSSWANASSGLFLEAIVSSPQLLLGGLEFRAEALTVKDVQELYYSRREAMRLRSGPALTDEARISRPLSYVRKAFNPPGYLLAPPLLIQQRSVKTMDCDSGFATWSLQDMWKDIIVGPTCQAPFQCADEILKSPLPLIACSSTEEMSKPWYGRQPSSPQFGRLNGVSSYSEFLAAVTDVPLLVRGGETLDTSMIIDEQTQGLSVLSLLEVWLTFQSGSVEASYEFSSLSSMEGSALTESVAIQVTALIMAVVLLCNTAYNVMSLKATDRCRRRTSDFLLVSWDLVLNLLVVAHGLIHIMANFAAKEKMLSLAQRLSNTPWESQDLSLLQKTTDIFYTDIGEFQLQIRLDAQSRVFTLVLCWAVLLRLIQLTSAHPRTAMLVNTFVKGVDDLWHFLLLFILMFGAFGLLARALFGNYLREFATLASSFRRLFLLMLGSLPDEFGQDAQYTLFILVFVFTMYVFVMNFLLAIIVESYLAVKQKVDESDAEQGLMTDVASMLRVEFLRLRHGWPSVPRLLACLYSQRGKNTVGVESLASAGRWSRESRLAFQKHYRSHPFIVPTPPKKDHYTLSGARALSKDMSMSTSPKFFHRATSNFPSGSRALSKDMSKLTVNREKALEVALELQRLGSAQKDFHKDVSYIVSLLEHNLMDLPEEEYPDQVPGLRGSASGGTARM
ncbi:unnamed protein product, partial [Polarella glacialis]